MCKGGAFAVRFAPFTLGVKTAAPKAQNFIFGGNRK